MMFGPLHSSSPGSLTPVSGTAISGAEMLAQPVAHLLDRVVDLGYASDHEDERVLSLGHRVYLGGDLDFRESVSECGAVCPLLRRRGRLAYW